jgi:two-component system sensor histidine kinase AtoS
MSADALRQVLLNLTLNALNAVPPENGHITWHAASDEKKLDVWVEDNGSGIDADIRKRLFEPFVATRNGTGLGLAIVARLMNDVGGTVSVERTDSSGTTFVLTFPKDATGRIRPQQP